MARPERIAELFPAVVADLAAAHRTPNGEPPVIEHIVIQQSIVTADGEFVTEYAWDGERFPTRARAVSHGFKSAGSDDFNVAVLTGGKLTWFGWMDRELDRELLPDIAEKIGVKA